jgi:hypothetical protein
MRKRNTIFLMLRITEQTTARGSALLSATQSVTAAPRDRRDAGQSEQNSAGTYKGYPLSQWYRTDGW